MKKKDVLEDSQLDRPLSKETAKLKYDASTLGDEMEHAVHFENLVEAKIKRAMAEGAFDNLRGKGQPIDLRDYYTIPEHLRMGCHMLKNSGYLPEEVRLKKKIASLKEKMHHCISEEEKQKLMKALSETSQQFHLYMEYNKKFAKSLF